jgi:hypothetical protein
VLFASQAYLAALNAIMIELGLKLTELTPENTKELRDGVIAVLRRATHLDEDGCMRTFNRADRVVQLNLVALGSKSIGAKPMLLGAEWLLVNDPLQIDPKNRRQVGQSKSPFNAAISITVSALPWVAGVKARVT